MSTNTPSMLWGMHAGYEAAAENLFFVNQYLALGWHEMGDLGIFPDDREAFRSKLKTVYPDGHDMAHAVNAGQLYRFVHEMRIGDPVACRPQTPVNGSGIVFLGKVAGPYLYNPFLDSKYPNVRRVEWLRTVPQARFSKDALAELAANMSLFQIDTHAAEFFAVLAESK